MALQLIPSAPRPVPDQDTSLIRISPAIAVLIFFATGIAFDRYWDLSWQFSLLSAITGLAVWLICFIRKNENTGLAILMLAVYFAGAYWHHGRWNWFSPHDISSYCSPVSQPGCIRATVLGEGRRAAKPEDELFDPIPKTKRTRYRVQPQWIRNGTRWEAVSGVASLTVHQALDSLEFGDEITIYGKLFAVRKPTSPGQFDFQNYCRAKGQTVSIHAFSGDAVVIEKRAAKYSNASVLSSLRKTLDELIWRHVDSSQAGFASAILLGNREQLTPQQRDSFLVTGTAHLLAISGLHIGILASLFLVCYRIGVLNRRWALLLTIAFVIFYSWLVEFRPPVSRAAILLSLFCLGRLIGRSGNEFNLLAIAGFIVLIINPSDLFQLGPQLSFLAVSTLVLFKDWIFPSLSDDPIERLVRNTRPAYVRAANKIGRRCKQAVLVSGLIWLIGLPLVSAHFHLVTPVALVVNPFVLFPIGLALFSGLGVCVFGSWLPPVAEWFGMLCGSSLGFVSNSIEFAETISCGHWWTAGPTTASIVVFYSALLAFAVFAKHRPFKVMLVVWFGWLTFGWLVPFQLEKFVDRYFGNELSCVFVDVGHGSSVLLRLPFGKNMLYDAGSLTSSDFAAETVSNVVWSEGIEHLDAVVISHADLDHFNAMPKLIERFSIGTVYFSFPMADKKSETVDRLVELIHSADIPIRNLAWDDRVAWQGDAKIEVLLPPEFGTGGNDNSDSIVLLLELEGTRLILPGDLEDNGMQLLLGQNRIDCDVAVLPHHGSKNSRPDDFISWCSPETAVISAGRQKLDVGVVDQAQRLNCEVWATADVGTIRMQFSEGQVRVASWSDGKWKRR